MVAPATAILARPPPSTSGPGRHPFKVVARVRIPLGASRVRSHADPHGTGSVPRDVRQVAAGLATEIDREWFAVSLWLAGGLAFRLDDRPDSLQIEVGDRLRRLPEVDPFHLA